MTILMRAGRALKHNISNKGLKKRKGRKLEGKVKRHAERNEDALLITSKAKLLHISCPVCMSYNKKI